MSEVIKVFEGTQMAISSDGMWNATVMCRHYKKRINNFLRNDNTEAFLKSLEKKYNLTPEQLVRTEIGKGKQQGTWVHQKVALKLAAWLNPDFEVWVFDVIEKLLTEGTVKLDSEITALKEALGTIEAMIEVREKDLTEARAEAGYWKDELTLYRDGHHPDYEEVGQYKPNFD